MIAKEILKVIRSNQFFRFYHQKEFNLMKTFFVLGIFFNIGALFLTNVLVTIDNPNSVILESNPAASAIHGFESHAEAPSLFKTFMIQCFFYFLLFLFFNLTMNGINKYSHLIFCVSFFGFFCFVMGYDFFNNLGFLFGKLFYHNICGVGL